MKVKKGMFAKCLQIAIMGFCPYIEGFYKCLQNVCKGGRYFGSLLQTHIIYNVFAILQTSCFLLFLSEKNVCKRVANIENNCKHPKCTPYSNVLSSMLSSFLQLVFYSRASGIYLGEL